MSCFVRNPEFDLVQKIRIINKPTKQIIHPILNNQLLNGIIKDSRSHNLHSMEMHKQIQENLIQLRK